MHPFCRPRLPAGTPDLIAEVLTPPDAVEAVQHVEVVAVDEVDACFQVSTLIWQGC